VKSFGSSEKSERIMSLSVFHMNAHERRRQIGRKIITTHRLPM